MVQLEAQIMSLYEQYLQIENLLMVHNWQKRKSDFLTCPCLKIYREGAGGLKSFNYTFKNTNFVNM